MQGSVLRLLEAERGVDLEEEGDAVVPGEAQGGVSPERVALVDDVDVPAGVEPLEPLVDVLVQEEGEGLAADDLPRGAGGHAPDLRAEQTPEAVRPDVDNVGPHCAPALAVGRAGGEDPHLRSPRREGIHQLTDVRRPALGADDGNAAIGADVSDVRRSHADTR